MKGFQKAGRRGATGLSLAEVAAKANQGMPVGDHLCRVLCMRDRPGLKDVACHALTRLPRVKRDHRRIGVAVAEDTQSYPQPPVSGPRKVTGCNICAFGVPRFDRENGALPRDACPLLLTYRCPITLRPQHRHRSLITTITTEVLP